MSRTVRTGNAWPFLEEFNAVEDLLRSRANAPAHVGFMALVDRVGEREATERRLEWTLRELADLRSAIVHGRRTSIAEPYDETVETMGKLRTLIESPPRVNRFRSPGRGDVRAVGSGAGGGGAEASGGVL